MPCWIYKIYHWFRMLGSLVLLEDYDIYMKGTVIAFANASDGDFTFDVKPNKEYEHLLYINGKEATQKPGAIHCEITPCYRDRFIYEIDRIKIGSDVVLSGDYIFDGSHVEGTSFLSVIWYALKSIFLKPKPEAGKGWVEIHPVKYLDVL